jgi:hypothetical protein
MNLTSCPHESELRNLIEHGQWPVIEPNLRAHMNSCCSCGDLALVAEAFQHARAVTIATARPVSPGILWWRAQLRRRIAAVERIGRPLLGAQLFALAVTLLSGLGFAVFEARHGVAWFTSASWRDWFAQLPQCATQHWQNLFSSLQADPGWIWMVALPASATLALLGGVAVYLATDRQ